MQDKVRLAPVGLGRWARVLADGAQRGDTVVLFSRFSRDEERRAKFAEEYGIGKQASSYAAAAGRPRCRGRHRDHPQRHPPRRGGAGARGGQGRLHRQAHRPHPRGRQPDRGRGRGDRPGVLGRAQPAPPVRAPGDEAVDRGRPHGEISLAEANFSNERGLELTPQTWRYYASKSPGGAFIQLGVHHADTLQYLLGPVRAVSAHAPPALHQGRGPGRDHGDPGVRERRPGLRRHRGGRPQASTR